MACGPATTGDSRTPIGLRRPVGGIRETFAGVTKENYLGQIVAGITLIAIAIPEQLATSQLAGVAAYTAMIAFIAATLVFVFLGSNPIMSVGADSTIAPLFAVAILRLAPISSTLYLELAAMIAVVTGLVVLAIGLLKLGWIADFLSLPIVTGFLTGIGIIIIVHQLPSALGVTGGGETVIQRIRVLSHNLGGINGWSIGIALGTLALLLVGEKINARLPWALAALAIDTVLCAALSLGNHGVKELGAVSAGLPTWRLHWLSASQWGVVFTTAVTLVIVILSQTSATSRTSSDELGVESDISRDFVGVGLANVAAGLAGAFPVNASPARTTVVRVAGGRTKVVGLTAVIIALAFSPFAHYAHAIPLAALAGVLFFVAARLIKVAQLTRIFQSSRLEFLFGIISTLGVILIGVEQGLAIAVGLAILDQTWRSSRPQMIVMGRKPNTTSWEPVLDKKVEQEDGVLAVIFDNDLFFANAGIFRRQAHDLLVTYPDTKELVIDAVAIADIDFTGMTILSQVVADLTKDGVTVTFARVSPGVQETLSKSFDPALRKIKIHGNVNDAVAAVKEDAKTS